MSQNITHQGIVDSTSSDRVSVRIVQSTACSSCSAAHLCQSSEKKEKIIEVVTPHADSYRVGQEVTIVGSVRQGMRAVLWAYVLPLVVMLVVMGCMCLFNVSDAVVALAALLTLVVYYLIMYMCRNSFRRKFSFEIE